MATANYPLPLLGAYPGSPPPLEFYTTTEGLLYLQFDSETSQYIYWTMVVPDDYASGPIVRIQWSNEASDTGNFVWSAEVAAITPNSDTDSAVGARTFATINSVTDAGVATARLQSADISLSNDDSMAAGDNLTIKFQRDADDASDTATEEGNLFLAEFVYTT